VPSAATQAPVVWPQRADAPSRPIAASAEAATGPFAALLGLADGALSDSPFPQAINPVAGDSPAVAPPAEAGAAINPPDAQIAPGPDAGAMAAVAGWIGFAKPPPAAAMAPSVTADGAPPDAPAGRRAIPDTAEPSAAGPARDAQGAQGPPLAAAPGDAMPAQAVAVAAAVPAVPADMSLPSARGAPNATLAELPRSSPPPGDVPAAARPGREGRPAGAGAGAARSGARARPETLEAAAGAPIGKPGAPAPAARFADRQEAPAASAPDAPAAPRFEPSARAGAAPQAFAPADPIGALGGLSALSAVGNAAASSPAALAPPPSHADPGVPLAGLAVEIAARALEGKRRFEIRLDPPELGRIDVRLDVGRDGQVTSRLVVERAETLDLLRRDAPALERALHSAGLRTGESGLEFSLRDQSGGHRPAPAYLPRPNVLIVPDADVAVREAVLRGHGVLRGLGRGIDIRV
jgi:flagellar hook-length control protein FliK